MSDRLTRDGLKAAVEKIEAHWPTGRSKWTDLAVIYPTLGGYSDDLVDSAVRRLIHQGETWQPGPVDVLRTVKELIVERAAARRDGAGPDHPPGGHVWQIVPDAVSSAPEGMREAVCVIPGCGAVRRGSARDLASAGERRRHADPAGLDPFG